MGIANRLAQRSGFAIMILLLIVSTLMAWGIQETFSERSFQIYHQYTRTQELLTNLRRVLWEAGICLRDYYIDPTPDIAEVDEDIRRLSQESRKLLADLRETGEHDTGVAQLETRMEELWRRTTAAAHADWEPTRRFDYLQKDIAPLRDEAGRLLKEIEAENHRSLTDSDQELRNTKLAAARRLLVILGICLVCGVFVSWSSIRNGERLERESAARFQEVLEGKQQLEDLSARLMEVQEEERTRLSRELHDEIVQNLGVLKMEIAQAQNLAGSSAAREPLVRARRLAEETVRTVRDISLLLRPSLLDDLGLGPALQWQTEEFSRRTGVPCRLEDNGVSDELPEAIKTCVYRVAQEALRNCEKHSAASSVLVRLSQTNNQLEVVIEDNGKGFNSVSRKPTHLGLVGMRERALALGGTLQTSNRPGGGARVCLCLPLSSTPITTRTGAHA